MNAQRKAELKMVLSQLEVLHDRLEELQDQEQTESIGLSKRERKAADEVFDTFSDALDSVEDAIRSLEDLTEE